MPHIDVEWAWIAWDSQNRREHLIIAAQLSNVRSPFAYLIPTPSNPEVRGVDSDLRQSLTSLIAAYQRRAPKWSIPSGARGRPREHLVFAATGLLHHTTAAMGEVGAVEGIIASGRYRDDVAVREWAARYVQAGAFMTVVRMPSPSDQTNVTSPWIWLTFEADRPYYPYREPAWRADDRGVGAGRLLRIAVVTSQPVAWKLGASLPTTGPAWLSFEPRNKELTDAFGRELARGIGLDGDSRRWLTAFEDAHEIRPGDDDLTFAEHGTLPPEGAPGTIADQTGAGIAFEPMSVDEATQGDSTHPSKPQSHGDTGRASAGPWRSRRIRMGLTFGAMVALALGAMGWLARSRRLR